MKMIDLHTHSLFSDGVLLPSELVRRAEAKGIETIGIADHVDRSNVDIVVPRIVTACKELNKFNKNITAVAGAEITHLPPELIKNLIQRARELGAEYIIVHGETIVEPVKKGTNLEAIKAGTDILAHPGLITEEEVKLAKKNNVCLEISGRKGHSLTNGHVVKMALKNKVPLVFNTDFHAPGDFMTYEEAVKCIKGAGVAPDIVDNIFNNSRNMLKNIPTNKH